MAGWMDARSNQAWVDGDVCPQLNDGTSSSQVTAASDSSQIIVAVVTRAVTVLPAGHCLTLTVCFSGDRSGRGEVEDQEVNRKCRCSPRRKNKYVL